MATTNYKKHEKLTLTIALKTERSFVFCFALFFV